MAHLAFQMAAFSGKRKKTLDMSYYDLLGFLARTERPLWLSLSFG
jgi:hypothetical protein